MKGKGQNGLSNTTERCIVDVEVRHHAMYSLEINAYGSLRVRRYDCVRHLLDSRLAGVRSCTGFARVVGNRSKTFSPPLQHITSNYAVQIKTTKTSGFT